MLNQLKELKNLKKQITVLKQSKNFNIILKKETFFGLRSFFSKIKKQKFKKEIAESWRKSHFTKKVFKVWMNFKEYESDVVPYEKDDQ